MHADSPWLPSVGGVAGGVVAGYPPGNGNGNGDVNGNCNVNGNGNGILLEMFQQEIFILPLPLSQC